MYQIKTRGIKEKKQYNFWFELSSQLIRTKLNYFNIITIL